LIDKPWVWNVFASYLIRIVSDKKQIIPNFLLYFFQSNKYRDQISWEVVWAAQPNFNGNKLWEIILPIPPLSKQAEIVSYLDQVFTETSELKSSYQAKLTQLKELKASILQSAFEGKLIGE
jgi:type I restriction enzyme S subunit